MQLLFLEINGNVEAAQKSSVSVVCDKTEYITALCWLGSCKVIRFFGDDDDDDVNVMNIVRVLIGC